MVYQIASVLGSERQHPWYLVRVEGFSWILHTDVKVRLLKSAQISKLNPIVCVSHFESFNVNTQIRETKINWYNTALFLNFFSYREENVPLCCIDHCTALENNSFSLILIIFLMKLHRDLNHYHTSWRLIKFVTPFMTSHWVDPMVIKRVYRHCHFWTRWTINDEEMT